MDPLETFDAIVAKKSWKLLFFKRSFLAKPEDAKDDKIEIQNEPS